MDRILRLPETNSLRSVLWWRSTWTGVNVLHVELRLIRRALWSVSGHDGIHCRYHAQRDENSAYGGDQDDGSDSGRFAGTVRIDEQTA